MRQKSRALTLFDARTNRAETRTVADGANLADVLRGAGFALDFDCGGRGVCGRCRVRLFDDANGTAETPLACQRRVDRDGLRVDVSNLATFAEKRAEKIASPEPTAPLVATSEERAGKFGFAVDLGTTTLVAALVSLDSGRVLTVESRRNPQIEFGRDVVSRIAFASQNAQNAATLRRVVVRELGRIAAEAARKIGVSTEKIAQIVVAGNATEEFLLCGRDVSPLGAAPFFVAEKTFPEYAAPDFDWEIAFAPGATVRVFPVFSAFVGGDVLAGFERLRAAGPSEPFNDASKTALFLDVGTNGETILSARGRYFSTSTAAGPAFEGSEISCGSLAVDGAIRSVEFDAAGTIWRPRTVGNAAATSVCGSGLIDALAGALATGAVAPNGRLRTANAAELAALPADFRARLEETAGTRSFRISNEPAETASPVRLTQRDVRQVQLAVGAIRAGLQILFDAAGVSFGELDALYLAGGFGAALDRTNARRVGLLPPEVANEKIVYCGVSSLFGAVDVLTKRLDWATILEARTDVSNVELATNPRFAEVFAAATRFPNPDDPAFSR